MKLTILDPGHFHAALVQKQMYAGVKENVLVYAKPGPDLDDYLRKIEDYNGRAHDPTHWRTEVYAGPDFLDRLTADRRGGVIVIAGNNRHKSEYLMRAVAAGFHTLADKPMAIDTAGFDALGEAFAAARVNGVLLYDIMTERHEITTMLQKELSTIASVFGGLAPGSEGNPAITKESVHHFAKRVSGVPVKRPAWFFDTAQQGEGLVDITTHLVDLVQWECFPDQIIDYRKDVRVLGARRWPTAIGPAQFENVTREQAFPAFLRKDVQADGNLHTYTNGEISYTIKGMHAKISVLWKFEAPPGAGDTHYSVMRGTIANLVIRQGEAESYQPVLSIEPSASTDPAAFASTLARAFLQVQAKYPGVWLKRTEMGWKVTVPASYHLGHEAHFGQVTEQFLRYVADGALPAWEVPNMLAKYYITTTALALARR